MPGAIYFSLIQQIAIIDHHTTATSNPIGGCVSSTGLCQCAKGEVPSLSPVDVVTCQLGGGSVPRRLRKCEQENALERPGQTIN